MSTQVAAPTGVAHFPPQLWATQGSSNAPYVAPGMLPHLQLPFKLDASADQLFGQGGGAAMSRNYFLYK